TTMHRQIEAAAPAADQLRQCARAYVGFARAQPHLWRLCFEHVLPPGQTPPPGLGARIAALVDLLLQPLAQAIGRPPAQVADAAQALWAGVHGICVLTITGKLQLLGDQTTADLVDDLVGNYL